MVLSDILIGQFYNSLHDSSQSVVVRFSIKPFTHFYSFESPNVCVYWTGMYVRLQLLCVMMSFMHWFCVFVYNYDEYGKITFSNLKVTYNSNAYTLYLNLSFFFFQKFDRKGREGGPAFCTWRLNEHTLIFFKTFESMFFSVGVTFFRRLQVTIDPRLCNIWSLHKDKKKTIFQKQW